MLTREQNDFLTQTGAGTPMGELFRRYWLPALLAEELPEPDCPPVRVKLLSERLLAFRDSAGKLGLIDEFCAHRGVSLWFGRNEQDGLRCPYHGWKYDVTGQCVEVPSEPVESGYAEKIKLTAYPLIERGGVLWTYMGPPELQPPLPEFEFAMVGPKHRFISKRLQESNYLQSMEGGLDPNHSLFLHKSGLVNDPLFQGAKGAQYTLTDLEAKFEAVESEGGLLIGARRKAEGGNYYWRVMHWVMPCFTTVAPRAAHPVHGHFWVPIDDEHCWTWSFDYLPTRELTDKEVAAMKEGHGVHAKLIPGTFRPVQNKGNDYLMDREAQRTGKTYSGVDGIGMQDSAMQESMGPIQDRTKEHLISTDNIIILTRQRLRRAALALQKGVAPPALNPSAHHVRSAELVLPPDAKFKDSEAIKVRPGVPHATV
ncbi:MAG: Rieske (2Fe-2S) protein [Noviherbaspirillum sp.]|nr:Rieske (2Fe-2S) protein [Noviherbaspirillum sp.]